MLASMATVLVAAGTAGAVIGLPADGSQVNNDPAAGIDPNQNAGASDVVGGSLAAGGPRVPWATFEQQAGGAQRIFVRAFKNGQWVTQGPSLNIDPNVEAEAPSIDFAGAGRTVPWDAWDEPNTALGGEKQIFASRFVAATNTWQPEGQDRGSGVPSLNINTDKEAENPSVAGGAAVPGADPVPWVAWQEQDGNVKGSGNHDQIFVSKGVKQAAPNSPCTGFKPSAANSVSEFCWQQVGLDRLAKNGGSSADRRPDAQRRPQPQRRRARHRVHRPERQRRAGRSGTRRTSRTSACATTSRSSRPGSSRTTTADGGFHWKAVGNGTRRRQHARHDRANGFGPCAESTQAEDACSLNKLAGNDAEDPRVAAGTLVPGTPTVPWVTWSEDVGGHHAIFVSRLVGGTTSSCSTAATRSRARTRMRARPTSRSSGTRRTSRGPTRTATTSAGSSGTSTPTAGSSRHAGRHPPDGPAARRRSAVADRRARRAVVELHRGPVHRGRLDVRAG